MPSLSRRGWLVFLSVSLLFLLATMPARVVGYWVAPDHASNGIFRLAVARRSGPFDDRRARESRYTSVR